MRSLAVFMPYQKLIWGGRVKLALLTRAIWAPCRHIHSHSLHMKKASLEDSVSLLKLSKNPSLEELRDQYIHLAKVYHPDSGSTTADPAKFTELQEAYNVVYAHLKGKHHQENPEEEFDEDWLSDHIAPQHRNFLNFGGFGFGPPSQREKAHQKHRAMKAFKKVSDHQVKQSMEGSPDYKALKAKVKKNKSTNLIERMVEDMIQESMAKGDFENLPGKGKPLPSKTQYCPFMDISQHNLNQVLVNNGVVPGFVALDKEIRHLLADLKSRLYKERIKLGHKTLNSFNQQKWSGLLDNFYDDINKINEKIAHFNLVVPFIRLQKIKLQPDKELQKVLDRYQIYEENMLESEPPEDTSSSGNQDKTFLHVLNSLAEKIVNRIFLRNMEKEQ